MPSRPRGYGRAMTRLTVALVAVVGLATGCSGPEPAPVPTTAAPSGPSAEELLDEKRATLAKAAEVATASADAADAQITLVPGVQDVVVEIGPPAAGERLPAITSVTFAAGTPVDQLRSSVTAIGDVLVASGLALGQVDLTLEREPINDSASWTGSNVSAIFPREAALWVQVIETNGDARVALMTHTEPNPLSVTTGSSYRGGEELTGGAAYLDVIDACVAAGFDPTMVSIETIGGYSVFGRLSTPMPADVVTAVEQADILDYVTIGGITRDDNQTTVFFTAAEGAVPSDQQQLALLGPFEHFGLLDGGLIVLLDAGTGDWITLWPRTPAA